jgi:hypothetical protein
VIAKSEIRAAKEWRQSRRLSVQQLAELSGYAIETIYFMERGGRPSQPTTEFTWQRYKQVCAAVDTQLRTGREFSWEVA